MSESKMPLALKRRAFDQCVLPTLTYGCETWALKKDLERKLQVAQRGMERCMLGITRRDKKRLDWIREQTQETDIMERVRKPKLEDATLQMRIFSLFPEMSEATKRKHVFSELLQKEYTRIEPNQQIVRVKESKGNNLHEVELPDSTTFLVSMPCKYRKNVWIKKGDYIVVEPIEEGAKVKAEMVKPLSKDYIKFLKFEKQWPAEFDETEEKPVCEDLEFVNTNRRVYEESTSEESD